MTLTFLLCGPPTPTALQLLSFALVCLFILFHFSVWMGPGSCGKRYCCEFARRNVRPHPTPHRTRHPNTTQTHLTLHSTPPHPTPSPNLTQHNATQRNTTRPALHPTPPLPCPPARNAFLYLSRKGTTTGVSSTTCSKTSWYRRGIPPQRGEVARRCTASCTGSKRGECVSLWLYILTSAIYMCTPYLLCLIPKQCTRYLCITI